MTKIEEVARAITAALPHRIHGDYHLTDEQYIERHWYRQVPAASAAITAMRKPTSVMVEAGQGMMPVQNRHWINHEGHHMEIIYPGDERYISPASPYVAMVDAVLEEKA